MKESKSESPVDMAHPGAGHPLDGAAALERKFLSCSQVKSWVKELTWLLIGSLFSDSQSEARLAL